MVLCPSCYRPHDMFDKPQRLDFTDVYFDQRWHAGALIRCQCSPEQLIQTTLTGRFRRVPLVPAAAVTRDPPTD